MRFLVDAQLPPALAKWIGERGYSASAVRDVGLRNADDGSIFRFASEGRWVVVTKDEDFAVRSLTAETGPVVVWLRIGNSTNRVLVEWLGPLWSRVIERIEAGDRLIELR